MSKNKSLVAGLGLMFGLIVSSYYYDYGDYGHELKIVSIPSNSKIIEAKVEDKNLFIFSNSIDSLNSNIINLGSNDKAKLSLVLEDSNAKKIDTRSCILERPKRIAWCKFTVIYRATKLDCICDHKSLDYQKTEHWNLGI